MSTQGHEPSRSDADRQDAILAIIETVTGASRDQILEAFADYPGKLREFKNEVLDGGPLWLRLRRHMRRG